MADRPTDPRIDLDPVLDPRVEAYLHAELRRAERDLAQPVVAASPHRNTRRAGVLTALVAGSVVLVAAAGLVGSGLIGRAPMGQAPVGRAPAAFDPSQRPSGERVVRFDSASLSEDGRLLKLSFVGGKEYDPANPCTAEYAGWAKVAGDVLEAAVVDITPPYREEFTYECTAEGYDRDVTVMLPEPFLGVTIKDLAGYIHTLPGPSLGEGAPTEPPAKDCGTETATGPNGPWNIDARECFWALYLQGTPAMFTTTRPTTEGDPITTVFRVYGPGTVEVVEDTTLDRFGAQAVTRYACSDLTPLPQSSVQPDFAINAACTATVIGTSTPHEPSIAPTASPAPSAPEPAATPGPAKSSMSDGGYLLVLSLPQTTIAAGEPLTGEAVLTTEDGSRQEVATAADGPIVFGFEEIGGNRSMSGLQEIDCTTMAIPAKRGYRAHLAPAATWAEDGPDAAFYKAFSQAPEVRLPPGAWRVTALAHVEDADCTPPEYGFETATVVVVTPFPFGVACGPMDELTCQVHVARIAESAARSDPHKTISGVTITSERGSFTLTFTDGTGTGAMVD
jgi:hypothetical protein